VVKLRFGIAKARETDSKATNAAVKAVPVKTRNPAIGAGRRRLYIWYKLIDGNKQPEKSNIQRITVHKEFPISTERHAKSNVNQLLFFLKPVFSDIPVFRQNPVSKN